ncbi:MAG: hypothetical protein HOO06_13675 [Bdellovibrionaceae bacterium]|jgi:hypothetical protein|nr:hypothetical protein [Pseudobdellovibrionaceae bacterium]
MGSNVDYWDKYNDVQKKISLLADSLGVTEVYLRKNAKNFDLLIRLQVQRLLRDKLAILETIRSSGLAAMASKPIVNINSYRQLSG